LRGFSALGFGELFVRVSRIVTTVVLARYLDAAELGIAAAALACYELVRILTNNGIGQMVVRAPLERLEAVCNTANRLSWMACGATALIQVAAGLVIVSYMGRTELLWMILCLTGTYLFQPWGMVSSWLLQREYRMKTIAAVNAVQAGTYNLLAAVLAVMGMGPWAVVLPVLIAAPIWPIGMRLAMEWKRREGAGFAPSLDILRFAAPVLVSEILVAVRLNVDKLLVGAILGLEALGIYFFAFGAGYGLSLVLTSALATASYPHLADHRLSGHEVLARFDKALMGLALPISALIGLQALAVYYYVPLLFGEKWAPMTPIVAVLCISAATKAWHDLSVQLLRAAGLPGYELIMAAIFTATVLGVFTVGLMHGLLIGVAALSIAAIVMQLILTAWARHLVARRLEAQSGVPLSGAVGLDSSKA